MESNKNPEEFAGPEVTYHDQGMRALARAKGDFLLDVSRLHGIPHLQECGGHGRCTTCRIRVLHGSENLSPPTPSELRLAAERGWPEDLRLACQARVNGPVAVERLVKTSSEVSRLQMERAANRKGEEKSLAILFCDIRDFTPFTERSLLYDALHIINRFFTLMVEPVLMNNGLVIRNQGDEIVALFGIDQPDKLRACLSAIRSALGMQDALHRHNKQLRHEFDIEIRAGIGLHIGKVITGLIGHPRFRHFSVIGDPVNVASRVQDSNKILETSLLVSEAFLEVFPEGTLQRGRSAKVRMKGKHQAMRLFEVLGFQDHDALHEMQRSLARVLDKEELFSSLFYNKLFSRHPGLRPLFERGMAQQGVVLTHMLKGILYAMARPENLSLGLRELGRRHLRYGLKVEYFGPVKEIMLETLAELDDEEWDEPSQQAWNEVLDRILDGMAEGAHMSRKPEKD